MKKSIKKLSLNKVIISKLHAPDTRQANNIEGAYPKTENTCTCTRYPGCDTTNTNPNPWIWI